MAAESYARNFLAAGGIDAVSVDASGGTPEKALRESGATVAVLCSDVAGYRASGASLASELAGNGARAVYAVGTPGAGEDALEGRVSGYLHDGCDLLAELSGILRIMGILKT